MQDDVKVKKLLPLTVIRSMSKEQLVRGLEETYAAHRQRLADLEKARLAHKRFNDSLAASIDLPRALKPKLHRPSVLPPPPSSGRIKVVSSPGDMCGDTRRLEDGSPCPGCRACC